MELKAVRKMFLNYFESKGHTCVASAPVITDSTDKSLLFVNAGMAPFKDVFLGKEKRDYVRATSSQKCIRAGGKHNDLENVGYTARHHTFFEMLGNFSFGDYFKEKAILYAWELLTKEYGINPEKLLVTVYHTDDEAYDIWKKLTGFGEDKILRIATKDNFWEMGKVGPCGPCTEIFYDHGDSVWGGKPGTKDEDGDRYMEIWNNVFMQNYRAEDESLSPLPNQNIDTGMGLERVTSVLQGKTDNYDIDIFQNIMARIEGLVGQKQTKDNRASFKVVADHIRCLCFMIADGVLPSNEGRGYVLRRILRRAMRHSHILGAKEPILNQLISAIETEMGDHYPELINARESIVKTIQSEEESFSRTLSTGLKILEEETKNLSKGQIFSGKTAFKLYDTYGFPIDMTADALRSKDLTLDQKEFDLEMENQKERSRANTSFETGTASDVLWFDLKEKFGETLFVRYSSLNLKSDIQGIVFEGKSIEEAPINKTVFIITKETPFYAESGGQAGDIGSLGGSPVLDTQKIAGGLILHHVRVETSLKVGQKVQLTVDNRRRQANIRAHSSAHLFQSALRDIIGSHAVQRGSSVKDDVMRFDFSHAKGLSDDEVRAIETHVNQAIFDNRLANISEMPKDEALKKGVTALFGEKYGEIVRVVTLGKESVELCGGTHVQNTGEIGFFKIISEGSLASGVRRIEAYTGPKALIFVQEMEALQKSILGKLKAEPMKVLERIDSILDQNKQLSQQLGAVRKKSLVQDLLSEKKEIKGIQLIQKVVDILPKDLKTTVFGLGEKLEESYVLTLISHVDDKVSLIFCVSENLADRFPANEMITTLSEKLGGQGGGGTLTVAQAGGSDILGAQNVFDFVESKFTA
ncbi:MAG: alanine--tRNA ligase [Alphaproteobacteria bacterium]|nr:alanine--tRNA ligase [Alphaproteobacteria bacterium]